MAVVATAERGLIVYQLENQPSEFRRIDSPLKHQVTLPSPLFCHRDIKAHRSFYFETWLNLQTISSVLPLQHRCVAIFKDKQNKPTGFALGSIEGRVAIHYINPPNPWVSNASAKNPSGRLWALYYWKISLSIYIISIDLWSLLEPKTTLPLSATVPMEPTQPLHRTFML